MKGGGKPAVVLLSGGLDSATALAWAIREGFEVHALTFRYGQRHAVEVVAARRVADYMGVAEHIVVDLDLRVFGGSALTGDLAVPRYDEAPDETIPVTYVPARNTIFLSFALAWSEVLGAPNIVIGANRSDASGYPDCRPAFLRAFERVGDLATREGVEGRHRLSIHAPLGEMSKAEVVRLGQRLGVPFGLTWTCYDPTTSGSPCGECDACALRTQAFAACDLADPLTTRLTSAAAHGHNDAGRQRS